MKRWCAALLALVLCISALSLTALAEDKTLDVTYVTIDCDGFVAETMNGVAARYNLTTSSPLCSELVERYYREVYGVTVVLGGAPTVSGSSEYWFEQTAVPKQGDILYATAAARGSVSHYALCRSVDESAGTVTLFEQNWTWNGKAGIGRVIPLQSCYTAYTLVGANGVPETGSGSDAEVSQPDNAVSDEELIASAEPFGDGAPSDWAQIYVLRAESLGLMQRAEGAYQKPVMRGEYARLVVEAAKRFLGLENVSDNVLTAASELGLMGGDASGNFHENESLTREEAAVVMHRLLKKIGSAPEADGTAIEIYADRQQIAAWSAEAVGVMTQAGLMGGTGTGFAPQQTLTLEQAIALLMRVYDNPNIA